MENMLEQNFLFWNVTPFGWVNCLVIFLYLLIRLISIQILALPWFSQAKFKARTITTMVLFFSLTTPTGIAIGILISKRYNEYSPTALIVQGVLDSASAGILIYMALVDLLAADFMNPKLQTDFRVQLGANLSLLLGACCMSLMAKWGDA